jgi:4a-hydroxytetrahydrobiopterin dehydratase
VRKDFEMALAEEKSEKIEKGTPPLNRREAEELAREVPDWKLVDSHLEKEYHFKDFDETMKFVNRVAEVAKQEDHHPDIEVSYNKVRLELSTHSIGGLSRNDFRLAAKISRLL